MLILHTQCSVNTIDSMSICLKNVGVKILVFMFDIAALTLSFSCLLSDKSNVCSLNFIHRFSNNESCHSFDETA